MEYKLIDDNVSEIASNQEIEKFELNLARLKASKFLFPVELKELFDLYFYNLIVTETYKGKLFQLRLDLEHGKQTSREIAMLNREISKQLTLNKQLEETLIRELDELNVDFDVEAKSKAMLDALKKEKKYNGTRSKYLQESINIKTQILNEINEIVEAQEPGV